LGFKEFPKPFGRNFFFSTGPGFPHLFFPPIKFWVGPKVLGGNFIFSRKAKGGFGLGRDFNLGGFGKKLSNFWGPFTVWERHERREGFWEIRLTPGLNGFPFWGLATFRNWVGRFSPGIAYFLNP